MLPVQAADFFADEVWLTSIATLLANTMFRDGHPLLSEQKLIMRKMYEAGSSKLKV
jgi:hypothetical protein